MTHPDPFARPETDDAFGTPDGAGSPAAPAVSVPGGTVPSAPPGSRPRRWPVVVLGLAVAALAGLLASVVIAWGAQNAQLRDRVEELTVEGDALRSRVSELETVEAQLAALKERYSSSVNLNASAEELVAELEDIADAYATCVGHQQDHFAVLHESQRYVPSSVAESERSIIEFCDSVDEAYDEFLAKHG
ncbi:hypothetical protein [Demequina pelophila]|uniref:hypothetical protein n=1 Tax=Demequina pelophila TaxID=1638984 RepID=UPI0007854B99|nr:hypothetical protein [Demequina pelophila]